MKLRSAAVVVACAVFLTACTSSEPPASEPPASEGLPAAEMPEGAVHVGEALEGKPRVTLAEVRSSPEKYFEQTLLLEATVVDVCQSKGCWMTIEDGDVEAIWISWSTGCGGKYAFPKDAGGKRVLVQGSFYEKEISKEDAEHLAGESKGLKAAEISGKTYEMNATAVVVLDS